MCLCDACGDKRWDRSLSLWIAFDDGEFRISCTVVFVRDREGGGFRWGMLREYKNIANPPPMILSSRCFIRDALGNLLGACTKHLYLLQLGTLG